MLWLTLSALVAPAYAFDMDAVMERSFTREDDMGLVDARLFEVEGFLVGTLSMYPAVGLLVWNGFVDKSERGVAKRRALISQARATNSMDLDVPGFKAQDVKGARKDYVAQLAQMTLNDDPELLEIQSKAAKDLRAKLPQDGLEVWERRFDEAFNDPKTLKRAKRQIHLGRLGVVAAVGIPVYSGLSLLTRAFIPEPYYGGNFPLPSLATEIVKEAYTDLEPHLPTVNVSFESGE